MSAPKPRLPTNQPLTGLHAAAFAHLTLSGLPPGPEAAVTPDAGKPPAEITPNKRGRVVLRREKAGRGGKTVIVIHDFATHLTIPYLEKLVKGLRAACGCGGTVRERTIEIQGDQPARIRAYLQSEGFQVAGVT